MRSSARRAWSARRPLLLACVVALRLIAVLLSLEYAGIAHAAIDGVEAFTGVTHHDEGDCSGDDCAPGCPSCHCWHAGMPPAPLTPATLTVRRSAPRRETGFVPYAAMPPHGADPDSVYRPPRPTHALH